MASSMPYHLPLLPRELVKISLEEKEVVYFVSYHMRNCLVRDYFPLYLLSPTKEAESNDDKRKRDDVHTRTNWSAKLEVSISTRI